LQLFIFTGVEVFLKLATLSLKVPILFQELFLACLPLGLWQCGCITLKLVSHRLDGCTLVNQLFFTF
jgi:hypothetical protein